MTKRDIEALEDYSRIVRKALDTAKLLYNEAVTIKDEEKLLLYSCAVSKLKEKQVKAQTALRFAKI